MIPPSITLDSETTMKNVGPGAIGKNKASPFCPQNRMVSLGLYTHKQLPGRLAQGGYFFIYQDRASIDMTMFMRGLRGLWSQTQSPAGRVLVIGHHLKFDLLWLRRCAPEDFWRLMPFMDIWDTQHVEYLLTGQSHQFAKLDDLIKKYGGTPKDDKIKAYWDAGVDTDEIPREELLEYMENDVRMTHLIFLKQLEQAERWPNMLNLIKSQMSALLGYVEMEWNGIFLHQQKAEARAVALEAELEEIQYRIKHFMGLHLNVPETNPASPVQMSALLFGGILTWKEALPLLDEQGQVVHFKTGLKKGQVKTKLQDVEQEFPGLCPQLARPQWKTKNGLFSTSEGVIKELAVQSALHQDLRKILDLLLVNREKAKDLNTYFRGYLKLVNPADGLIHHNLNNCATHTGRLSSSNPNLQNVTHGDD